EAGMVSNANREFKNNFGTLAYIFSAAQQFFTQEDFNAKIELDDQVLEFRTGAVTVANAAPPTSVMAQGFGEVIPNDGLLDVTIPISNTLLEDINTSANLLVSAFAQSQIENTNLVCLRTNRLKLTTDPPQTLVVDGEILEANPIEFTCIPNGLTILSPLSTV
ncbi:MAG: lipid kinase, partial [Cyanobacteria bacterium P01_F01_bin.116]